MKKKKTLSLSQKITFGLLGFLLASAILVWIAVFSRHAQSAHFVFCDVGQGDAIFIESPQDYQVLVDGGPDTSVLSCLGNNMPFYDKSLDLVILTHPDADHVTGLVEVVKRYEVEEVWLTQVSHESGIYEEFLAEIEAKNILTQITFFGTDRDFEDGLSLTVLWPEKSLAGQKVESLNNTSIVIRADFFSRSVLLTGDVQEDAQEMWSANLLGQVRADILKIPHHGARNGLSFQLLKACAPQIAVISVGAENRFGHPASETVAKLANLQLFRTDQDGEIRIEIEKEGEIEIKTD